MMGSFQLLSVIVDVCKKVVGYPRGDFKSSEFPQHERFQLDVYRWGIWLGGSLHVQASRHHKPRTQLSAWTTHLLYASGSRDVFSENCLPRMFRVNVSFPSGCGESFSLPQDSSVGDLKVVAQKSFVKGFLKFVTAKGDVLTKPTESLQAAGIWQGEHLTAVAQKTQQQRKALPHSGAMEVTKSWHGATHAMVVTALQFKIISGTCSTFSPV